MDLRELPTRPFVRHPWEVARARCFIELVSRCLHRGSSDPSAPVDVLDVGAGDGYLGGRLLEALPRGSRVTCFDPNYSAEYLRTLGARATAGLTYARDCSGRRYDCLLVLDVIEHVADDRVLLADLVRDRLKPGGYAIVSAPAWPVLFTAHDTKLGHLRRYRPTQLASVVANSGLEALETGPLFMSLLLARSLAKMRELARGEPSRPASGPAAARVETDLAAWHGGRRATAAIVWALQQDFRAGRRLSKKGIRLPGLSAWVVARRPDPV